MQNAISHIRHFLTSEDGPTAVEYAVMLALILVVSIAIVSQLGESISATFEEIDSNL
ncbi:hypothetical protein BH23PLA1_BH23PLA1_16890 [soil metagenome]